MSWPQENTFATDQEAQWERSENTHGYLGKYIGRVFLFNDRVENGEPNASSMLSLCIFEIKPLEIDLCFVGDQDADDEVDDTLRNSVHLFSAKEMNWLHLSYVAIVKM